MDEQDGQDGQDKKIRYEAITQAIIGAAFEVSNELGAGFLESVYEKALLQVLYEKGIAATAQKPIKVMFRGACVGEFIADLLVLDKVIIELKAVKALTSEHQAQIINYLNATGIEVGLLLNFGTPRMEFKRFTRWKNLPPTTPKP